MMKNLTLLFCFLFSFNGFSQVLNDYQYVIVPTKFDFLKEENEYRLSTIVKKELEKLGFIAFYENNIPKEVAINNCEVLKVDLVKDGAFFWTIINLDFKDCQNNLIFRSKEGRSKEKEYKLAYLECVKNIFESLSTINYNYKEKEVKSSTFDQNFDSSNVKTTEINEELTAVKTTTGFILQDKQTNTIYKLTSTGKSDLFLAQKGEKNGMMYQKDKHWVFEYTDADRLVTEIIFIKF
jgi:hypothetical protein